MNEWTRFWERYGDEFGQRLAEHIGLTLSGVGIAILIGVPFAIALRPFPHARRVALGAANILQTVPALALLALLLVVTGRIGVVPTVAAMVTYCVLPIMRNTLVGLAQVPADIVEAARALGMNGAQTLARIELPLALPGIFTGVRTATSWSVGTATLGTYIGAGGLGEFISRGIAMADKVPLILAGTIPAAALALLLDALLAWIEKRVQPWNTPRQ